MSEQPRYKGWIAWFTYNPVAANLLMISLLIVGAVSLATMRTEGFPEPDPSAITINVGFDGGSPEIIEEGVVIKIEDALNGLAGIDKISAQVTSNQAIITVQGEASYPLQTLKDNVKTRIDSINTFPEQVDKVIIAEAFEERHILYLQIYGLTTHDVLKTLSQTVRERLLKLDAVNKVTLYGSRSEEINIEINEAKLRVYNLSFNDVAQAVQNASLNLSAGELNTQSGKLTVQNHAQRYYRHQFEELVVRSSQQGGLIKVKDVASVRDGFTEQATISRFQGQPSINLDVELIGKDSVLEASTAVNEFIQQIKQENWLPETVNMVAWADESVNVRDSLSLLSKSAVLGISLVLIMLALFLDLRVAFWVAVGIPVAFAGTFFVMGPSFLNYSINDLSVFAFIVVLGIVVDDAIIIGESIYSYKKQHGGGTDSAIAGALTVATPATFGVLTTVAAFYPLTTISGFFAGPFKVIAVVTIICLLFSLVESKLILPAHLAKLDVNNRHKQRRGLNKYWRKLQSAIERRLHSFIHHSYQPLLHTVVKHRYQSLLVFISIFILSIGLVSSGIVKLVFFGDDEGNLMYAAVKMPQGTPAAITHPIADKLESAVQATNDHLKDKYQLDYNPVLYTYTSSSSDNEASVTVEILPGSDRPFFSEEFLEVWQQQVGPIPKAKELSFYLDYEGSEDLSIELSSYDPQSLRTAMLSLRDTLHDYPGISDIRTNLDDATNELQLKLKPEAELLGLNNRSISEQIRYAVYGFEAQRVQRGTEEVRVKVRYPLDERDQISDLNNIRINTDDGTAIPVTDLVEFTNQRALSEITRVDGNRVFTLTAKIDDDIVTPTEMIDVLQHTIFPQLQKDYPNTTLELAGESEAEEEAGAELNAGFILGLLLIYILLAVPLKSYIEPFMIMLAIPFGIIGAIIGHYIVGIPLSLLSFFGILALSGVVVNDALILVNRYNQNKKTTANYQQAIIEAGLSRFRAVLLTSITTFVGLLPLLAERSEQAQNLIPMAVSLSFGILFATLITLLLIPALLAIKYDADQAIKAVNKPKTVGTASD